MRRNVPLLSQKQVWARRFPARHCSHGAVAHCVRTADLGIVPRFIRRRFDQFAAVDGGEPLIGRQVDVVGEEPCMAVASNRNFPRSGDGS